MTLHEIACNGLARKAEKRWRGLFDIDILMLRPFNPKWSLLVTAHPLPLAKYDRFYFIDTEGYWKVYGYLLHEFRYNDSP